MNMGFDEFGNAFLLLRENEDKQRIKGIEALKANIFAAKSVAQTLTSSLGPKGMDKIIISADGNVTVTNDGATILDKMEIEHQCAKLLVELSKSQDDEIGDGTTGVVVFAGALLDSAYRLLEKGLHPLKIADGFEYACNVAINHIASFAQNCDIYSNDNKFLIKSAMTSLGSKVVSSRQKQFAKIAVDAVLAVADLERKDVNFDLIKIEGKPGGRLEETCLIHGIVLDKDLSHSQMQKITRDAKIAILTCPFEPPKPKTKHKLDIKTAEDYIKLQMAEKKYFTDMIDQVISCGANFVICQWGFDDEANHMLMNKQIPAVRWVGGVELELIAIATGGRIVSRFEELKPEKLGRAGIIKEITVGTEKTQMVIIEECANSKAVTVCIRGGNSMIVAEAERSLHDAMCCVRNLIRDSRIVPGGGATEISAAIAVDEAADTVSMMEQYAIRAFGEALMEIPQALADNSGLNAIATVGEAKALQIANAYPYYGVNSFTGEVTNMMDQNIYESFLSKQHQLSLATQVVKMILKIDDIIAPTDTA